MATDLQRSNFAADLFCTNRNAIYGAQAHGVWREHVARENLAGANLLCNRLASSPADLSFLSSSTKDSGCWVTTTLRRERAALTLQRLDSRGSLPGSLQLMTASNRSLTSFDDDESCVPPDFTPSPVGQRRSSPWVGGSTGGITGHALRPQSGSLIRSATMQSFGSWGSHWDDAAVGFRGIAPGIAGLDVRLPKPRPAISAAPGLHGHRANKQSQWVQSTIAGRR